MMTIISLSCVFFIILGLGFINQILYVIDTRLCRKLNKHVVTVEVFRLFSIFSTYLHFRFSGENNLINELPDQYLIVSNHQSLLDIPLFMRFLDGTRLRFVAKSELGRNVPLVSVMLKSDQHCLVDRRGSPSRAMKTLDIFADRVIKNNWIPVVFPEGTRSRDGNTGTFHAAGFRRVLDKAPMPVVVCALDGAWKISSLLGLAKNLRGGLYRVKVLKIFPVPLNKIDQLKILEEAKVIIQKQLDEWRN